MKPKLISMLDLCTMLGIGKTKAYELLRDGELESTKIGSRRLILRSSAIELVKRSLDRGTD